LIVTGFLGDNWFQEFLLIFYCIWHLFLASKVFGFWGLDVSLITRFFLIDSISCPLKNNKEHLEIAIRSWA
jgi:hypothetical protein